MVIHLGNPGLRFSLQSWEQLLGKGHPDLYPRLLQIANLEEGLGRLEEAAVLRNRATAIQNETPEIQLSEAASNRDPGARLYDGTGRFIEPRSCAEQVLTARRSEQGGLKARTADQSENIAKYYIGWWRFSEEWRFSEAVECYERAIKIREKTQGRDHPDVAKSLDSLGDLYAHYSELDSKYAPLYERALEIRERSLDPHHPDVATSLINVASTYGNTPTIIGGERHESKQYPLHRRALKIRGEALGPEHPDTAQALEDISDLARYHDEELDELALFQRLLAIREKAFGPEHPELWRTIERLTQIQRTEGEYRGYRKLLLRQLAFQEAVLGPIHPDVASTLEGLGALAVDEDEAEQAVDLYQRALSINEELPATDQLSEVRLGIGNSLQGLANALLEQGRNDEAEAVLLRSLSTLEAQLGPDHSRLGDALQALAGLYFRQQKLDAAQPLYERLLQVWRAGHWIGYLSSDIPESLASLAWIYHTKDKYDDAEGLYRHAIGIWEKRQGGGVGTWFRKSVMETAVSLFDAQGRDAEEEPLQVEALGLLHGATGEERASIVACLQNYSTLLRSSAREHEASSLEQLAADLTETGRGGEE